MFDIIDAIYYIFILNNYFDPLNWFIDPLVDHDLKFKKMLKKWLSNFSVL